VNCYDLSALLSAEKQMITGHMQVKRGITGGIMSFGVIVTSIFAVMHSNLTQVNMNEVTIVENGERISFTTEAETVIDALAEAPIQFGNFDEVSIDIDEVVYDGMEFEIFRATPVIINDGGTRFHTMTTESDVEDVLSEHNIEVGEDDLLEVVVTTTNQLGEEVQLNPTALTADAFEIVEIELTRVEFETESSISETTLETEYIYTDDLLTGEREVRVEGSPKIEETVVYTEFRNGQYYTTINNDTNTVEEGVRRVVAVGTREPVVAPAPAATPSRRQNSTNTNSTATLETFTASVTAYQANCRGCSGFTASGRDVRTNAWFQDSTFGSVRIIAADSRFPFGTIMYIQGVGHAVVLDRGGSVTGNVLDVLKAANEDPFRFGRQSLQTQVLRLGW